MMNPGESIIVAPLTTVPQVSCELWSADVVDLALLFVEADVTTLLRVSAVCRAWRERAQWLPQWSRVAISQPHIIAIGDSLGFIRIYDSLSAKMLHCLKGGVPAAPEAKSAGRSGVSPSCTTLDHECGAHRGAVTAMALAADGKVLASLGGGGASAECSVTLWDVDSATVVRTLHCSKNPASTRSPREVECSARAAAAAVVVIVGSVAMDADAKLVAACCTSRDGAVRLWSTATGKLLWTFTRRVDAEDDDDDRMMHLRSSSSVCLSADGTLLASIDCTSRLRLCITASGQERIVRNSECPSSSSVNVELTCIALSPNGKVLACGYSDGGIRVLSTAKGALLHSLGPGGAAGHSAALVSLAISGNARVLASACENNQLKLWDVVAGRVLPFCLAAILLDGVPLQSTTTTVHSAAVSDDGKLLAVGLAGYSSEGGNAPCGCAILYEIDAARIRHVFSVVGAGAASTCVCFPMRFQCRSRDAFTLYMTRCQMKGAAVFNKISGSSQQRRRQVKHVAFDVPWPIERDKPHRELELRKKGGQPHLK